MKNDHSGHANGDVDNNHGKNNVEYCLCIYKYMYTIYGAPSQFVQRQDRSKQKQNQAQHMRGKPTPNHSLPPTHFTLERAVMVSTAPFRMLSKRALAASLNMSSAFCTQGGRQCSGSRVGVQVYGVGIMCMAYL